MKLSPASPVPQRADDFEPRPFFWRLRSLFLRRREAWCLTWRGWLSFFGLAFAFGFLGLHTIHPFLAVTARVKPQVLVIEGWIPDYALVEGWTEFRERGYTTVLTVGGPFRSGVKLEPDDNYGELAAYKLRKMFGAQIPVQAVKCPPTRRDRTFTSALAIKAWLADHGQTGRTVTVATLGPHARRSRLLFEIAFGESAQIGIVSLTNQEYDERRWWHYSEGVKEVVSEGVAYLYARLFFYPE